VTLKGALQLHNTEAEIKLMASFCCCSNWNAYRSNCNCKNNLLQKLRQNIYIILRHSKKVVVFVKELCMAIGAGEEKITVSLL